MSKTQIKAEIVADSMNQMGDRLTSLLVTFPRIILAEINTHRMLSKNTSSSRAIPFNKMVESVENDPFIPIAWQKPHKGMQGVEYYDHTLTEGVGGLDYTNLPRRWLRARDTAVSMAKIMSDEIMNMPITKQLANRTLEPFMWTTMLITGSKEGWDNFFNLRCPVYETEIGVFKSKRDALTAYAEGGVMANLPTTDLEWFEINRGQAEIHIMDLAEKIYDAMNENTPKELEPGEWHIPFEDKIDNDGGKFSKFMMDNTVNRQLHTYPDGTGEVDMTKVKISTAMAARTSYTVVGDEKEINYKRMVELHDRLLAQDPPHSSPMEHCARVMTDEEYFLTSKGMEGQIDHQHGWCYNLRGFMSYRYLIENDMIK